MANPARSLFNAALRMWSAFMGVNPGSSAGRLQGVVLHDPEAQKPQNLDNPFHDPGTQERVGDVIARSTRSADPK
jgi:hypothetical protein